MRDQSACDVLVIGSGAGGLAVAITARHHGLDVVVLEKEPVFGGTTAISGGWLWIPGNPIAARAGATDSIADARTYLEHELGPHFDAERVDAFLPAGPAMVEFFERHTALEFVAGLATPDFHSASPGAAVGRPICAAPFDGRMLGEDVGRLRPPLREITVAGMAIAAGADLRHFLNATRSPASAWHAGKRFAAHFVRPPAVLGRTCISSTATRSPRGCCGRRSILASTFAHRRLRGRWSPRVGRSAAPRCRPRTARR